MIVGEDIIPLCSYHVYGAMVIIAIKQSIHPGIFGSIVAPAHMDGARIGEVIFTQSAFDVRCRLE